MPKEFLIGNEVEGLIGRLEGISSRSEEIEKVINGVAGNLPPKSSDNCCWYCGADGELESLESPLAHYTDCAWRAAKDLTT